MNRRQKKTRRIVMTTSVLLAAALVIAGSVWLFLNVGVLAAALLPSVASLAFVSVNLKRLSTRVTAVAEANRTSTAALEALATAINARDQINADHIARTRIYAVELAKLIGLEDEEIDAISTGVVLHDVGKLAIPDYILNKSESLTDTEFEKIKVHTLVGASIATESGFDPAVANVIKYHHERWDGKGYPEGIAGENIPLPARILSICDAFDKLRAPRPYRPAMDVAKACSVIRSESGTRFDPAVVDMFLENLSGLESAVETAGLTMEWSERKQFEERGFVEQIKRANREVFSLYELAREFSSSLELTDAVNMFAVKLGELIPFDTCVLYLLDETKRTARAAHVVGANADLLITRTIKVGQGATGYVLKTQEGVTNVDPDLDFSYAHADLTGVYSTMASVPLLSEQNIIGSVAIYASELQEYTEEHVRLFETVSKIAADAIGKSLKHDEAKIHALTDPMTDLPNARSLKLQFEKEVARSGRTGKDFQLLMLDLDGFKAVNDSFGHKVGDELLRQIGQVIRAQLRDYDFLARYGGDEFVALIPETSPKDVLELCDRIEDAVCAFKLPVDQENSAVVGVSLGSAGYPDHGDSFDEMIVAADKAMYFRKTIRKGFSSQPKASRAEPTTKDIFGRLPADDLLHDPLIVELDETHVIS